MLCLLSTVQSPSNGPDWIIPFPPFTPYINNNEGQSTSPPNHSLKKSSLFPQQNLFAKKKNEVSRFCSPVSFSGAIGCTFSASVPVMSPVAAAAASRTTVVVIRISRYRRAH
ncbi:hypothetical protein SLE2022_183560 [Rubroshorea leprosula]